MYVFEVEHGLRRMLHVDPVERAVDGGALGVEFSVALELGSVNAHVVPDLRQSRVHDTVGGEAVMKQHVAGDVRLDEVDRVLFGVEDSCAREVEGAVDSRAHKTHRAEVTHRKDASPWMIAMLPNTGPV